MARMYHEPMMLPLVRELSWRDPAACFARLRAAYPQGAVFLDSALAAPSVGGYSYVAVDPFGSLRGAGRRLWRDSGQVAGGGDPFSALEGSLAAWRQPTLPDLPPFQGGAAGWLGYDLGQHLERLPSPRDPRRRFDDLALGLYDTVLAFDLAERRCWRVAGGPPRSGRRGPTDRARQRIDAWSDLLRGIATDPGADAGRVSSPVSIRANFSRDGYERAVQQVIDAILAGDIFQANLSQCFSARLPAGDTPWQLYQRLRVGNPAPFAAYIEWGQQVLASAQRMMRPPTMKAAATVGALNRLSLSALPNAMPSAASGMKAIAMFSSRRRASGSLVEFDRTVPIFARNSHMTARIAPDWMTISNSLPRSSWKSSRLAARIRCPVLETGRNSVRPSTTPRMAAFSNSTGSTAVSPASRRGSTCRCCADR